jgi:hypothetical protein
MFPEEVKQLINRTKTSSSRLDQLRLFLDDKGMIRCEGRIEHSSVSSESKKPVLLPAKHHVTDLIIQEHHDSANHTGINKGTLNRIRERYWILHGKQAVKRVLRKCVTCKRLEGKPYPHSRLRTHHHGEQVMTLPLVTREWISHLENSEGRTA